MSLVRHGVRRRDRRLHDRGRCCYDCSSAGRLADCPSAGSDHRLPQPWPVRRSHPAPARCLPQRRPSALACGALPVSRVKGGGCGRRESQCWGSIKIVAGATAPACAASPSPDLRRVAHATTQQRSRKIRSVLGFHDNPITNDAVQQPRVSLTNARRWCADQVVTTAAHKPAR